MCLLLPLACAARVNCIKGISTQAEMDGHALSIFCLSGKAGSRGAKYKAARTTSDC